MTEVLKIRRFGGSVGLILSKSIAESLAIEEGDQVFVTSTPEGISISIYDPDFDEALEDSREFMRSHRNAFKKLAQ
ncbi:MAG: AbrB/MazE/SpoVT family DNA-binding domain-containing protein [Rhodothermales bacterium]|nr:AbrB/MazE/SpoVT family DNA-binding domain-containing protein [Rhodothermales bacterium]